MIDVIAWYITEISYTPQNLKNLKKKINRTNRLSKIDEENKIINDDALKFISRCYFINENENIDRLHFCGWPRGL